jgi:hypothetical protein
VLLTLLRRWLTPRADLRPDFLLLGLLKSFTTLEWVLLLSVMVATAFAVRQRRRDVLLHVQGWSLALGLLFALYYLGGEAGKKIDLRVVSAIVAGTASLCCSYICLIAHAVLTLLPQRAMATTTRFPP